MADLTRSEAWELLTKYNKEPFHLRHALTVEGIMKYFAKELGYADEADFWAQVGLLHDLDFEVYPAEHCLKSQEIMREHGLDERLIRATASHGYGLAQNDIEPQHQMEKVLFAIDELSGLIGAAAIYAPFQKHYGPGAEISQEKYKDKNSLPDARATLLKRALPTWAGLSMS